MFHDEPAKDKMSVWSHKHESEGARIYISAENAITLTFIYYIVEKIVKFIHERPRTRPAQVILVVAAVEEGVHKVDLHEIIMGRKGQTERTHYRP